MAHDGVHNEVENRSQERVNLRHSVEPLEGGDMVTSRLCHHGDPSKVRLEKPDFPWAQAIAFHGVQAPVPVQGGIRLMKLQKDII